MASSKQSVGNTHLRSPITGCSRLHRHLVPPRSPDPNLALAQGFDRRYGLISHFSTSSLYPKQLPCLS